MKKVKLSIVGLLLSGMCYGQVNQVDFAKKLILNNVGNVTIDSPVYVDSLFEESEMYMSFAHKLLKENTNMTTEELEDALGYDGYETAIQFALSPTLEDKIEKSEKSWPKYITDLPIGIDVYHSVDTVYAQKSNRADTSLYPYIWGFGTTVMAINQDLEIIEFGAYDLEEGEWVLRTQNDNRPFNKDEFIKWYHCNDKGILYRGFKYSDNQNYLGKSRFLDGYKKKTLFYFIGKNEQGKKYVGAKEVIAVNNLQ